MKPVLPASEVSAHHLPHLLSTLTAGLHEVMNKLFTIHLLFEDWLHQSMGLLRTQNSNQTFCSEELGLPIKCPPSCFAVTESIQVSSCCHLAELMLLLSAKVTEKLQLLQSKGSVHPPNPSLPTAYYSMIEMFIFSLHRWHSDWYRNDLQRRSFLALCEHPAHKSGQLLRGGKVQLSMSYSRMHLWALCHYLARCTQVIF